MTLATSTPTMPLRAPDARRALRAPVPTVHEVATDDGVMLRLTRYQAGDRGPLLVAHGLGVSSRIFTVDTIETSLLEFLCDAGFDVWLLDYRVSIDLPSSTRAWTADDVARRDYPAAVATIRAATRGAPVHAVVHCYGATTFCMAMLAGLEGVASAVCSQVGTHVAVPWGTRLKVGLGVPSLLRAGGLGALTARVPAYAGLAGAAKRAYDSALALQPLPAAERCESAACRRITFMYGRLYEHAQLNAATHAQLDDLFGLATLSALEHLGRMVSRGHVVAADGRDSYLPHLDRLALPMTFIHGARNACYLPASTAATMAALEAANGRGAFERHEVPGYGHIDCIFGQRAATDVFPLVLRHLDRVRA